MPTGAAGRRRRTRSSRPTGCGSGSSRATGRCTRVGSGRRPGGRRCGCGTWGSLWCCGISGCGCMDAVLSRPRPGGRVILLERLRWETLLLRLLHVVEEAFGVADVTYTERDVEYELAM